jgi:outer membrane immunogenic protein
VEKSVIKRSQVECFRRSWFSPPLVLGKLVKKPVIGRFEGLKKAILVAVMSVTSLSSLAADISSQHQSQETVASLPRWAGLYLGVNRGFGGSVISGDVFLPSSIQGVGVFGQNENRSSGFIAGGQVGYNYQFSNRFILGAETDFQWSDIKASYQSATLSNNSALTENVDARIGLNWFGTLRGRVGYSLGRLQPYVTGGLLYGQLQGAGSPFLGSNSLTTGSLRQTKLGWAMGGGVDIALSENLSARSEYLYLSMTGVGGSAGGVILSSSVPVAGTFGTYGFGAHLVRGGLNYRFKGLDASKDFDDLQPIFKGDLAGFLSSETSADWGGFYFGVNGGYGGDIIKEYATLYQQTASSIPLAAANITSTNRTGGFLGGGQVGYNFHFSRHIVAGAETDAQWSGVSGQHEALTLERSTSAIYVNRRSELGWFGTTRLRAGYAPGNFFTYLTAGVSYGEATSNGYQLTSGAISNRVTQTRAGWVVGAGSEYSVTSDLSFKAEYLYVKIAGINGVATGVILPSQSTIIGNYSTGSVANNIMRVGANWKFGRMNAPSITPKP